MSSYFQPGSMLLQTNFDYRDLRSWIVEGDGVDHVLMAFESKKLRSTVNVPNFTSSVIASCQASVKCIDYIFYFNKVPAQVEHETHNDIIMTSS